MTKFYYQPILTQLPSDYQLAGGWLYFDQFRVLSENGAETIAATDVPDEVLNRFSATRAPLGGIGTDHPCIMGILNVTPDSFSDGGKFDALDAAVAQAECMIAQGAQVIDIGGESTRPGADFVEAVVETQRTAPIINAIREVSQSVISIDTRKADVARAALGAGANWINDVSAMEFDPAMAQVAAQYGAPICLMHAQGTPDVMQKNPTYANVVFEVYDALEQQVERAVAQGIKRENIIVDPGIGFGKTMEHNLALLKHLSVFHGLGCVVLLGASRKRFIGTLTHTELAADRIMGSVAVALHGLTQGVQIVRVHDVLETQQAFQLYSAISNG